jgi:hypothetical protein
MKIGATPIVVLIGVLWIVITVMGMTGLWFPALLLSIVLMVAHAALGSAHKGRLDVSFLVYPILVWAGVWAVSFIFAKHYSDAFQGAAPSFTFLGFHPSFAWIVFGFWIGGVAALTVGFSLRKDRWMSERQWEEFTTTVNRLNEERKGVAGGSDH